MNTKLPHIMDAKNDVQRNYASAIAERLEQLAAYYRRVAADGRDLKMEEHLRFVAKQSVRDLVEEWI